MFKTFDLREDKVEGIIVIAIIIDNKIDAAAIYEHINDDSIKQTEGICKVWLNHVEENEEVCIILLDEDAILEENIKEKTPIGEIKLNGGIILDYKDNQVESLTFHSTLELTIGSFLLNLRDRMSNYDDYTSEDIGFIVFKRYENINGRYISYERL